MARRVLTPSELGWYLARKFEARQPHSPTEMKSDQSKSPPFGWECPVCKWGSYAYTYLPSDPPPVCSGGANWSFTTRRRTA